MEMGKLYSIRQKELTAGSIALARDQLKKMLQKKNSARTSDNLR
jgi:hypothetical protein